MRAESKAKKGKGKVGTIVLFLALPVLLLIVFTYIPFVYMFKNSLTDWDGISETSNFVGLKNLRALTSLQTMQQANVNKASELDLDKGSQYQVDLIDTALGQSHPGHKSLNDVMSEWNKKWADGIYEAETAGGK